MNSKEKLIIERLLALATKQQKVLTKLAQANMQQNETEANKGYLKQTWQVACLNSGVPGHTPTVEFTPGNTSADGVTVEGNYMVTGEVPAAQREKFDRTFKAQIAAQKPDLDGKVSVIFKDPSVA